MEERCTQWILGVRALLRPVRRRETTHAAQPQPTMQMLFWFLTRLTGQDAGSGGPRTIRLLRGDISLCGAEAIATSTNPRLEGTRQSSFWRFSGRKNADGAIRSAGGPELARATFRLAASAAPLAPGSAVATAAGGQLKAQWVIHCVACLLYTSPSPRDS